MVNKKCKKCSKFLTNDCRGLKQLNSETCQDFFDNKYDEVDISGCC